MTHYMNRARNKKLFSLLIFLSLRGATPPPESSIIVTIYNSIELNTEHETLNTSEDKMQLIEPIIRKIRSRALDDYVAGTYWQT